MQIKNTLLLCALFCYPTQSGAHRTLEQARPGIYVFTETGFSASDLPGDALLITASTNIDTSGLSFALAPYGLKVCYTQIFSEGDRVTTSMILIPDFDIHHKTSVLLVLPSGQRKRFSLPHTPR